MLVTNEEVNQSYDRDTTLLIIARYAVESNQQDILPRSLLADHSFKTYQI
jgi:hypothetical protein